MKIVENDENLVGFKGLESSECESETESLIKSDHSDKSQIDEDNFINENNFMNEDKINNINGEISSDNRFEIKKDKKRGKLGANSERQSEENLRKSSRERKPVNRYGKSISSYSYANIATTEVPLSYKEVLESENREL